MAATDGQITLAASRFGDTTPAYLRDFAKCELPAVAKITKGQYHNLGVPTLSNPSLQSTALFLNAGKKYQILAQPIKIKDGRKPTNVGPKVLIPESYPGYFELLSEDGRSTRCIDSVADLSRKQNLRVLVRETFRCNHLMKTIHAGEILTTLYDNGKYLKCRTQKDEVISLPLEAKAKFSPIAKEESISGVHSVKNLLKKRMPVVVRLVYGTAPKGLKQPFVPELRLLGCVEIDRVFALPLQKDTDLVAVPLNAKLKLQRAKNMDQLGNFIEYLRFLDKAQRLLAEARDRLQIVDIKLSDKDKKDQAKNGHLSNPMHCINLIPGLENGYVLRKSLSCDSSRYVHAQHQHNQHQHHHQHRGDHQQQNGSNGNGQQHDLSPILDEYNDIDQIYDYVRGLAPLPKNLNRFEAPSSHGEHHHQPHHHHHQSSALAHQHQHQHQQHHQTSHSHQQHHQHQQQQTLASTTTTSTSIHKSPSTDMAKSQPDSGNYSLIRTSNNNISQQHQHSPMNNNNSSNNINNNNNSINSINSSSAGGAPNHNYNNHTHSSNSHQFQHQHQHHHHQQQQQQYILQQSNQHDDRPVPPPIETIPGKKLPEKRQRPTLPKLYVKNSSVSGSGAAIGCVGGGGGVAGIVVNGVGAGVAGGAVIGGHSNNTGGGSHQKITASIGNNVVHSPASAAAVVAGYVINAKDGLEPQSPLFHIRYKSLSSLQLSPESNPTTPSPSGAQQKIGSSNAAATNNNANMSSTANGLPLYGQLDGGGGGGGSAGGHHPLMKSASTQCAPREGTLDSSRSGGRTSGDSNKLPEKKTRRLSRPRSLSNLVWELRPQKEKTKKKLYVHHYDNRQQQTTLYL